MVIDKIFVQETGSFLVLLHMSMVGQISYCGQNSHASGEFLCQLPGRSGQSKDGLGAGGGQCEHPHIVTALSHSEKQRYWDVQGQKRVFTGLFMESFLAHTCLYPFLKNLPCTCSHNSRALLTWQAESSCPPPRTHWVWRLEGWINICLPCRNF